MPAARRVAPEGADPVAAPWDPRAAAEASGDLRVVEDPVAALLGGAFLVQRHDRRVIVLDPSLHPWERRAALAHEVVHAERGIVDRAGAPAGWDAVVEREERRVRAVVADRLVPPRAVDAYVAARLGGDEPVTAEGLAALHEVPLDVANQALEHARARHDAGSGDHDAPPRPR